MKRYNIYFIIFIFISFLGNAQQDNYKITKSCFNSPHDDFGVRKINNSYFLVTASIDTDSSLLLDQHTNKPYTDLYEIKECRIIDAYLKNELSQESWLISSRFYDGPIASNNYGNLVFFSHNESQTLNSKMGLFFLHKNKLYWSSPNVFPYNSDAYNIVHPFYDDQSNRLYFSSDMPGGKGGFDIYYVNFDGVNFGKIESMAGVNSPKNELFPCYTDNTLYFTSNVEGGYGMYDIYSFEQDKIKNLGDQINSPFDDLDMYFINEYNGFFSSNRDTKGLNDDSYFFVRIKKEELNIRPEALMNQAIISKIERSKNAIEILSASSVTTMMLDLSKTTMEDIINKSEELSKSLAQNTSLVYSKLIYFSDTLKEQIINSLSADYNKKMIAISEMNRIIETLKTENDSMQIEALLRDLENAMNLINPELTSLNHAQVLEIRSDLLSRLDILSKQLELDNKLTETSKLIFAEVISLPSNEANDLLKDKLVLALFENLKNDEIAPIQAKINENIAQKLELESALKAQIEEFISSGLVEDPLVFEKVLSLINQLENSSDPKQREQLLNEITSLLQANASDLYLTNKNLLNALIENNLNRQKLSDELNATLIKYNSEFLSNLNILAKNAMNLSSEQLKEEIAKINLQFGIDVSNSFYPDLPEISPELMIEFLASHKLNNILFAFDSYQIKNEYFEELTNLVDFLSRYSQFQIYLDGHTDNVGKAAYNLRLSKNRANSVKRFLQENGVKDSSFTLTPHGLSNPIADNSSKDGRRLNRRVEIRLVIR